MIAALLVSVAVGFVALCAYRLLGRKASPLPPPPGPKGLPFIGNLNDLPKPGELEAYHWFKHKDLYGPVSSVTFMGQMFVILNEPKAAFELLEKRSAVHSSRPRQVFAGEMIGWDNSLGLCPYNDRFRAYRRNMARIIGSKTLASQFDQLQEAEAGHFLLNVLNKPSDLVQHIKREAGAVVLKITYGYTAESQQPDPLIHIASDAMEKFSQAAVPGAFLVDIFPFMRYLPEWLPGTGFKKTARKWRAGLREVADRPYAYVRHQRAQGNQDGSFVSQLLERGEGGEETAFLNKWSAQSLYAAGADTTVAAMRCFFLAMALHQNVQKKAKEEIDRVLGPSRLPKTTDREKLPYVNALVKEVLRWHPVAPMGLPHTSVEDDVYEGYFIPKGSMLLANIWHFTHDPQVYTDPSVFKPERFLTTDERTPEQDPRSFVFGFGRRICPGRYLAENALYLTISQVLTVFDIGELVGDDREKETLLRFDPGVISQPKPFDISIKPRSAEHERLVRSIEKIHPWQESDSKILESIKY